MRLLLLFIILISVTTSCDRQLILADKTEIDKQMTLAIEEAYFEGQKDALNGDLRIMRTSDSCFMWVRSPWNDESKPVYQPPYCR